MADHFIKITINTLIESPVEKVWEAWTTPEHIKKWNHASDDWHTPHAENDLRVGGKFSYTMAAKDGSLSFDFWGIYSEVTPLKKILSKLGDDRSIEVIFTDHGETTDIIETFDAEDQNTVELQRAGWQAILDNFKKYTESL